MLRFTMDTLNNLKTLINNPLSNKLTYQNYKEEAYSFSPPPFTFIGSAPMPVFMAIPKKKI